MNGLEHIEQDCSEFVEVDPTGRYGRYSEILGKGASKTVYRAFDEYEGIEVAWNQVKLNDFLQRPEDLERLYCEIHLLKTLNHKNIMKFYASWVDTAKRNINFITEMFTSGTLRQYRLKHKRVNIRAVKHWCRQILKGLLYLHSHDPPVIHRDLKCDNIFVNGNQGEVKIGDLGLAAILRKSYAAHCVGTPEFMAPEVYEEEYNELVDIYSFGMCILEMVTFEYPYSECSHPAQIYKKVISGKKPDSLYKLKDPEVRQFVEKCLATVSSRLSARELLNDPFLQIDDYYSDSLLTDFDQEVDDISRLIREPFLDPHTESSYVSGYYNAGDYDSYNELGHCLVEIGASGIELFEHHDDERSPDCDITIKGKRRDDGSIFLRIRITDKEDRIRNIYFPFDIEVDTAFSVATEMVAELDITNQDVNKIADVIDAEISSLVPNWKSGFENEENPHPHFTNMNLCENCASKHTSTGSFLDFPSNNLDAHDGHFLQCSNGCAAFHGRFEEITYRVDASEHAPIASRHCSDAHYAGTWGPHKSVELSSLGSAESCTSDEEHSKADHRRLPKDENGTASHSQNELNTRGSIKHLSDSCCFSMALPMQFPLSDDFENEVQHEIRWAKAKYQLALRKIRDQQQGVVSKTSTPYSYRGVDRAENESFPSSCSNLLRGDCKETYLKSDSDLHSSSHVDESTKDYPNAENVAVATAKSLCSSLLPNTLHRTTSLPVDAVHIS
ncbi:hypothetical protein Nepgr_013159 [Nepenthes gracilis]|uniref:non-specific serine/threonine protein kinase n=1 Tax=Nepenthes gracilis TaxID=150966 RepID=A0AAD3SHA3_NEPGR|nr:hypothetical protein Nepgr_013159 [Nepenthes gracilis]